MGEVRLYPAAATLRTQERVKALDPSFRGLAEALLEAGYAAGLNPQVSAGLRTPAEQDALHAQGRTEKGPRVTNAQRWQSLHNYGLAVDVFFLVDGQARWKEKDYGTLWMAALKAGLDRQGLVWSGTWTGSFREQAHFQLGRPDWRDLAREHGVDPITLNKKEK